MRTKADPAAIRPSRRYLVGAGLSLAFLGFTLAIPHGEAAGGPWLWGLLVLAWSLGLALSLHVYLHCSIEVLEGEILLRAVLRPPERLSREELGPARELRSLGLVFFAVEGRGYYFLPRDTTDNEKLAEITNLGT